MTSQIGGYTVFSKEQQNHESRREHTRLNQIGFETEQLDFQIMTANVANTLHDTLAGAGTYMFSNLGVTHLYMKFIIT